MDHVTLCRVYRSCIAFYPHSQFVCVCTVTDFSADDKASGVAGKTVLSL